jgi:hypothetical protein
MNGKWRIPNHSSQGWEHLVAPGDATNRMLLATLRLLVDKGVVKYEDIAARRSSLSQRPSPAP